MVIRSRISSILGLIGPEPLDLFALELKILLSFTLFTLCLLQISTNQRQTWSNNTGHKISCQFDYGCNWTRTAGVIALEFVAIFKSAVPKNCNSTLCCL